ncbi:hypothetical protein [Isobaculum melis]|nr:hypothetical protein [Isobaculum melis]
MSRPSLRSLALGFFLSAVIVFSYTTFIYKAPVVDSSVKTEKKAETAEQTEEEKTYKKKYEELLAETEVNEKKDSSKENASKDSSQTEANKDSSVPVKKEEPKEEKPTKKEYTLVIEPGEPSSSAIQTLAEQGIIKNADEFTQFLSDNNYETLVRDGSYALNSEMTYEEIAKSITHQ